MKLPVFYINGEKDLLMVFAALLFAIAVNFLLGCNGQQGVPGSDGHSIVGPQGPQGNTGLTGNTGDTGQPGTQILPIKFCPNVEPNYPSMFPEYGLCLNNQLYAVYSANNGFLALIPPGVYLSDAIGSACTFTVSANCEVN